jgi:NADH dehydrogenase [ubiquinone] 1 alpha subcomplex assembly factor 7
MSEMTPLEAEIRRLIAIAGPMPLAQYMTLCLTHPTHGYYMTRDPLGVAGDFTTAPEVSQMFGELIGLWAAAAWRQMGAPENVRLVELGPGRGTMMHDAVRAAQVEPAFRAAIVVHFVEISPALQQRQRQTLVGLDVPILWHQSLDEVPDGPVIILANEFFDALPVHQVMKQPTGWHERVIGIRDGKLAFGLAPIPIPQFDSLLPRKVREAPMGSIYEWRSDHVAIDLGRRVLHSHGAALIVDYGYSESQIGDTLQAVGKHSFADPFTDPGQVDLTAHVDFQALGDSAESFGAKVQGPLEQGEFLRRLGIDARARALKALVTPEKAAEIDAAVIRLTGGGTTGMGSLFKVVGICDPALGVLPGFET